MRRLRKRWLFPAAATGVTVGFMMTMGAGPTAPPTVADSSTANLWMDTNGGTCTRHATPATYVDAEACPTMNAAYLAAGTNCDTVRIKAGTYTDSPTAKGRIDYASGRSCAVTFTNATGATPEFDYINWAASYVTLQGSFLLNRIDTNGEGANAISNVLIDGVTHGGITVDAEENSYHAGWIAHTSSNIVWKHMDICCTYNDWLMGIWSDVPTGARGQNVTLDDVDLHDNREPNGSGNHLECLYLNGATNITITNSRFWACTTFDVFATVSDQSGYATTNITVTNSQFQETYAAATDGGCCDNNSFKVYTGPGEFSLDGYVFRHNTFETILHFGPGTLTGSGLTLVGNILIGGTGSDAGACPSGGTYGYNVTSGTTCAGTDTSATGATIRSKMTADYLTAIGNPVDDYHLLSGSVAEGAGEASSPSPATDRDGVSRGSPADAGLYER